MSEISLCACEDVFIWTLLACLGENKSKIYWKGICLFESIKWSEEYTSHFYLSIPQDPKKKKKKLIPLKSGIYTIPLFK